MKTYIYIDASNLFHGGKKSLGWNIDYEKFYTYLKTKYEAEHVAYFGGVHIHKYPFSYIEQEHVPINELEEYFDNIISVDNTQLSDTQLILANRYRSRTKFYKKLRAFGYELFLKPLKVHIDQDGNRRVKANCDIDMAYQMLQDIDKYDRVMMLSGDGDFLPILKHIRKAGKEVVILARGNRTAKELKQFVGSTFLDFSDNLRSKIEKIDSAETEVEIV